MSYSPLLSPFKNAYVMENNIYILQLFHNYFQVHRNKLNVYKHKY